MGYLVTSFPQIFKTYQHFTEMDTVSKLMNYDYFAECIYFLP